MAALALLALLLAGCAGPAPSAPGPAEGANPCGVLRAPAATPAPEAVAFSTGDGVLLRGSLWPGDVGHAVVLVHGLREQRTAWDPLARALAQRGHAVLAFDLRGHGASTTRGDAAYEEANFTREDHQAMEQDVRAALALLRGRAGEAERCLSLVGAGAGATLALRVAALGPDAGRVDAVALLSPEMEHHGLHASEAAQAYGARPSWLAAAKEDTAAAQGAQVLAGALERETLVLMEGGAHGTALLRTSDVQARLLDWMGRNG
jgi:alpha-beta hydrolase superfamily lysophospholipase